MDQYVGMDLREMVTVVNASYILGWLCNAAGGLEDPIVAIGLRAVLGVSCLLMFALTVDMKELFLGHDFHEVLAIYFVPFILAAILPWAAATALIPLLMLGGAVLLILKKRLFD
jgi:hypothetical protein